MSRAIIPKRFEPCLTLMEPTPDGCAELVLEVNGNFVSSTVLGHADMENEYGWMDSLTAWWQAERLRKC